MCDPVKRCGESADIPIRGNGIVSNPNMHDVVLRLAGQVVRVSELDGGIAPPGIGETYRCSALGSLGFLYTSGPCMPCDFGKHVPQVACGDRCVSVDALDACDSPHVCSMPLWGGMFHLRFEPCACVCVCICLFVSCFYQSAHLIQHS